MNRSVKGREARRRVLVIGGVGGTCVGGSLARAAGSLGIHHELQDASDAFGRGVVQKVMWHAFDKKPQHLAAFEASTLRLCRDWEANTVITTGCAPLRAEVLRELRELDILTCNISTDDPFNPKHQCQWFDRALLEYDIVFTPRLGNIADLDDLGCRRVEYLPFGWDPELFKESGAPSSVDETAPEVFFVGGADADRARFLTRVHQAVPAARISVAGSYWDRFPEVIAQRLGQQPHESIRRLTRAASINLCLVRRANRDGHVMRSFEIPAAGGCMIAEDTVEHRQIFGPDGESTFFFSSEEHAAELIARLLKDPAERERMAIRAQETIRHGRHSYADRLEQILRTVE